MKILKKIAVYAALTVISLPHPACADIDFLSLAQDYLTSHSEQMNKVIKEYVGFEANLQELSWNHNIVDQLRDRVRGELRARAEKFYEQGGKLLPIEAERFLNSRLRGVSLGNIASSVNLGDFVSPLLTKKVAETYIQREGVSNDVETAVRHRINSNGAAVDNLAALYANAFVQRRQSMAGYKKYEEEESVTSQDVNVVKDAYFDKMTEADHRWLNIHGSQAMYYQLRSMVELSKTRVNDISDVTGEFEDEKQFSSANRVSEDGQQQSGE